MHDELADVIAAIESDIGEAYIAQRAEWDRTTWSPRHTGHSAGNRGVNHGDRGVEIGRGWDG